MTQKYLDDEITQNIIMDMEDVYQDICMTYSDEEIASNSVAIPADLFCCMAELLMGLLTTYEGYEPFAEELAEDEQREIYGTVH